MPTWLITGCSTGLGRALAEAALQRGDSVAVTARDATRVGDLAQGYPDTALALSLDVTEPAQVAAAVQRAQERFGAVDVLVNNAGYGYRSAVEEGDDADVQRLFATNFFGPVSMIQAVLPGMRARRSGTIVSVSSIAANTSPAGSGYYAAAKAALEAMSASLRKEVGPLGIIAMIVKPGAFRTDFSGRSLHQSPSALADYAETAGKRRIEHDRSHGGQPGDPVKAAQAIIAAVETPDPPSVLLLGQDAVDRLGDVLDAQHAELLVWEQTSRGTDLAAG
jgi:NAD(P)-dependent dehydrogenase (short-subunit alcohol dehydrogenase family)